MHRWDLQGDLSTGQHKKETSGKAAQNKTADAHAVPGEYRR